MRNKKPPSQEPEVNISKIEEELLKTNPQVFDGIPKAKRQEVAKAVVSITKVHSGPLPPAELLQEYENIYPGSAKIIFDTFVKQSNHRIKMEDTVITSQQKQAQRGQVFALSVALSFLVVSAACVILGHEVSGSIIGTVDVLGIVAVFITGKFYQKSDLNNKNPDRKTRK